VQPSYVNTLKPTFLLDLVVWCLFKVQTFAGKCLSVPLCRWSPTQIQLRYGAGYSFFQLEPSEGQPADTIVLRLSSPSFAALSNMSYHGKIKLQSKHPVETGLEMAKTRTKPSSVELKQLVSPIFAQNRARNAKFDFFSSIP